MRICSHLYIFVELRSYHKWIKNLKYLLDNNIRLDMEAYYLGKKVQTYLDLMSRKDNNSLLDIVLAG